MKALHGLLCLPLSMVWACPGAAQPYPSRPIELVSPTGAGGGSDLVAWTVVQQVEMTQFVTEMGLVLKK